MSDDRSDAAAIRRQDIAAAGFLVHDYTRLNRKTVRQLNAIRCLLDSIPLRLKGFDFDSKMALCQQLSLETTEYGRVRGSGEEVTKLPVYPWCLSTVAMLSIMSGERESSSQIKRSDLIRYCRAVYGAADQFLGYPARSFLRMVAFGIEPIQLGYQYNFQILIPRYYFFFTYQRELKTVIRRKGVVCRHIDILKAFIDKFKVHPAILFAVIFVVLLSSSEDCEKLLKLRITDGRLFCANDMVGSVLSCLTMGRKEFKRRQAKAIEQSPHGYVYADNFLERYPIILDHGKLYVPCPNLLPMSSTIKLMQRLTANDNALREDMGKHVMEDYLLALFKTAKCYENFLVTGECSYSFRGNPGSRSPDVRLYGDDVCVLIESKLSEPSLRLRSFAAEDEMNAIRRYAGFIRELFKNMERVDLYSGARKYSRDAVYGVVVVLEDAHVVRDHIYNELRKPSDGSDALTQDDLNYIMRHISIGSLYTIEILRARNQNIVEAVRDKRADPSQYFNPLIAPDVPDNCKLEPYFQYETLAELGQGLRYLLHEVTKN